MKVALLIFLVGASVASERDLQLNQEFLEGYNNFTGDVYAQLRKSNPGNFLVSPISVDILLSLLEYGSEGETSKQLVRGLCLPENKTVIREAFSSLTPKLNVNDKYILTSANKIYVKKGRELVDNFKKLAVDVYNADVQNIDFTKKEAAAKAMNKWVEDKTGDKIRNLVDKNALDDDTRLLLINALYFRGTWVTKFNSLYTKKEPFHLGNNEKTEVELMDIRHDYSYYESEELQAKYVELPYHGKDVTLTIVLPNEKNGLANLEDNIKKVLASQQYNRERVHVKIPKFKIETSIDFNNILKKLGIVNAFEDFAEFRKITEEPLKITKVVQKALIEVDEEGTTAAAATAVYVSNTRSGHIVRETKEFIANHPFIFILKYKTVVLFIGHYTGK